MLTAALMPTFLLFGWMAARPATARIGSILAIYLSVQLALTETYSADFSSYANSSVALMLGVALTGVTCGIVRLLGADWIASRLLQSNWTTLAAVAERKSDQEPFALASLMQHRLALLAARITVVPADARSNAAGLRQLRTALNVLGVRQASSGLSRHAKAATEAFFVRLAVTCRTHTAGPLPDGLVGQLDSTIALILREPSSEARDQVLMGLGGVRSGLFPDSPAYQPLQLEHRTIAA